MAEREAILNQFESYANKAPRAARAGTPRERRLPESLNKSNKVYNHEHFGSDKKILKYAKTLEHMHQLAG